MESILDLTYGKGGFWKGSDREVIGIDIDPARAKDVCADFRSVPFPDESFDLVAFDPPYVSNMGKDKPSIMGTQFGSFSSLTSLETAVQLGTQEAWRVCKKGIIVKVQDHIRSGKLLRMTRWVEDEIPEPLYDEMHVMQKHKLIDPKWGERGPQLSLYRNHSTYMIFVKGSQYHRRRRRDNDSSK